MTIEGQTYSSLWKQVEKAVEQDLPQTEQKVLKQLIAKAEKERQYGHLLKATLQEARSLASVAPDSLLPAVERLAEREQQTGDVCLKAVYDAVLGTVYGDNPSLSDQAKAISEDYRKRAMAHPAELAAAKAAVYAPFVEKGRDSRFYDDDLLSLVAYETENYDDLHRYYLTTDNRTAQLLSAVELLRQQQPREMVTLGSAPYLQRLDSLISRYADLEVCGEAAIERVQYMRSFTNATPAELVAYINEALGKWGSWQRMNELRNLYNELTARMFQAQLPQAVVLPNTPQPMLLSNLRAVEGVNLKIYRVKANGDIDFNPNSDEGYRRIKPLLTALPELSQKRTLAKHQPWEVFEDSLQLPALPVGVYMIEVQSLPATQASRQLLFVSNVRILQEAQPGQTMRYAVVEATTGNPIAGAALQLRFHRNYRQPATTVNVHTDKNGEYVYRFKAPQERPREVYATTPSDRACPPLSVYGNYSYHEAQDYVERTDIFTDRAIYRPGQKVCVSAIVYKVTGGIDQQAVGGKALTFQLLDANYKQVGEQQAATDAFGVAAAEFTLPTGGLTGQFSVRVNNRNHSFRVEEYKRPTFEVSFAEVNEDYHDGDTLAAKGTAKTYAGVPVQGGKVVYKVVRRQAYWWMTYSRYWNLGFIGEGQNDAVLSQGETTTDDQGAFTVDMPLQLPKTRFPMFYNFVVMADVTDQGGETHQAQLSLPLGNRKTALTIDLDEKLLAEKPTPATFHLRNAAGKDIAATVRYQIDGGKWQEVATNSPFSILHSQFSIKKSGRHTIEAVCEGDTLTRSFVVFSLADKRPATECDEWFYQSDTQFPNDGTPVTIQVGASSRIHILYSMYSGKTLIESGRADKDNALINRQLTYKPEYGNGLLLTFAWVRDGKVHTQTMQIRRPMPDKQLRLQWDTFRDRLKPGQQEEWTLRILTPDQQAAKAQLMAVLYDKSLDQLVPNAWDFTPWQQITLPNTNWAYSHFGNLFFSGYQHRDYLNVESLDFSTFDHSVYPQRWFGGRHRLLGAAVPRMAMAKVGAMKQSAIGAMDVAGNDMAADEVLRTNFTMAEAVVAEDEKHLPSETKSAEQTEVALRENMQETAFFRPQLLADGDGRVALKFTLPESLTTWCFQGLAHTQDMMYGKLSGEAVAQKDVMIQPNMPRFIREGDEAVVTARIFNMTDRELSATARLQLIDPATEQVVYDEQQPCTLQPNGTASTSFKLQTSNFKLQTSTLLVAKATVSGEGFSDGEQHYLPVLPSQERVTVTVPFTQNEPGTKTINLGSLIPQTAKQQSAAKYTIEYTNNPAWLMVQALATIGQPCDHNAISQAASLYANTIGKHLIGQMPSAKTTFEQWKREAADQPSSLSSQLEKNQELKDLLLNETPWLMDADRETEQRQHMADFFDQNTMQQRYDSAIAKLRDLQLADGSWSWWKGMNGSLYMTVEVSEMLVRLNQMTGQQTETKQMLSKAFNFMGDAFIKEVAEIKRLARKGVKPTFPSFTALQWLYLCKLDGRTLPTQVKVANDYLTNLLKKERKNQTIYEKALSAIVLDSKLYAQSLKEYTVYREDMGRYYDTPRAGYSWRDYRIPTQVVAIEALQRLTPNDRETIEEMQRWLLQEKHAQAWDTPINSVDAVYAFLNNRQLLLAPQEQTVLKVDGKPLQTSQATAGIGYVKTVLPAQGQQTFTAEKTSTGTSWGAVYAQFMQPASDMADQQSGISVKREILNANHSLLKVGQRIKVRLTIVADRDLDFVQVSDKRAACMEPVNQLSGYHWGYYIAPKDYTTNYYFDRMPKGKHVIETEYFIDRSGTYQTGSCTAQCAYAPEFRGTTKGITLTVEE